MKIAYISPTFFSDVDLSLLAEMKNLADVDYYIQINPSYLRAAAVNISKQFSKPGVFEVSVYPELDSLKTIFPSEHTFVVNDTGRHLYSPSSFLCYYKLYRILKRKKYDIIHFTNPFMPPGFIMYRLRHKMVMTVHDPLPHSSEVNWVYSLIRKKAFSSVSNFIILNQAQKTEFIQTYHLEHAHVYDSMLSSYTYLRAFVKKTQTPTKYILMFGQISAHKGADYLLRAMEKVHQVYPDVKLVIAGRWKWQFEDFGRFAQLDYVDIQNRFIPDYELANMINDSLFVVVPYLDATQSGVVMSSFAFYKPCVVTNVGGLPEMVVDKYYGLVIPPKDIHSITEAIIQFLSNPLLLQQMSDNIRVDYNDGCKSWKYIAKDMINVYNQCLIGFDLR